MKLKNRFHSNKNDLKSTRKHLRNYSTSAEATLWNMLKNRRLAGKKFRRQHSLDNYIVDFYCSSDKLIVELDGDPHGDFIQIQRDEKRDKLLEARGYKVLRFENRFVFQDPELVVNTIISNLKSDTTSEK